MRLSRSAIRHPVRSTAAGEAFSSTTDSCSGAGPTGFTIAATIRTAAVVSGVSGGGGGGASAIV